jgi:hypothetical protein
MKSRLILEALKLNNFKHLIKTAVELGISKPLLWSKISRSQISRSQISRFQISRFQISRSQISRSQISRSQISRSQIKRSLRFVLKPIPIRSFPAFEPSARNQSQTPFAHQWHAHC